MKKIRVAQIGTSQFSHGRFTFLSLCKQSDLFEVVGYALPENEREEFPAQMDVFEGYREMTVEEILRDETIEAVAVETEEKYLTKYALMAAEAGKHVHMEKPGGLCLEIYEKLIETMKNSGKVYQTGYMYRFNPFIRELLAEIRAGELGEIINVDAQMSCLEPDDLRAWLAGYPGGMMFFLGCHLIDLVLQIQGDPKKIIPMNRATHANGVTCEDFGLALFEYENGVSLIQTNGAKYGGFARRQLVVTGTKKTVAIQPLEMTAGGDPLFTERTDYTEKAWGNRGVTIRSELFDRYDDMMEQFGREILGERPNLYSCDYELKLYRALIACCPKQ